MIRQNRSIQTDLLTPAAQMCELVLIGLLLLNPELVYDVVEIIKDSKEFSDPRCARSWDLLVKRFRENAGSIDRVVLVDALTDRNTLYSKDEWAKFADEAIATAREHSELEITTYAKEIHNRAMETMMIDAAERCAAYVRENPNAGISVIHNAVQIMDEVVERYLPSGEERVADRIAKHFSDYEDRITSGEFNGVPTGFIDLDRILYGLRPGHMIVLAARPSMGKSAFSLQVAFNAACAGVPSAFMSLEMDKPSLYDRLICLESEINGERYQSGSLTSDELYRAAASLERLSSVELWLDSAPSGIPAVEVQARVKRLVKRRGIQFVVIDYLQQMSMPGFRDPVSEISAISRAVKGMAMDLNIPIMVLSQLNRASETSERPKLHHLRGSGSIEQDADEVLFIHREDRRNVGMSGYIETNESEIIIAKQRNGRTGLVNLVWVPHCTKFKDMRRVGST